MIKKIIIISILLLTPALTKAVDRVFLLQLLEDKGKVQLNDISVIQSFMNEEQKKIHQGSDFYYNILDKEKNIINTNVFSLFAKSEESQVSVIEKSDIAKIYEIEIPYIDNADKIVVFNKENLKIGEKEVAKYASDCGDKTCQAYENYSTCSNDCPPNGNDGFCFKEENDVCDPDCLGFGAETGDKDCPINRDDYNPDLEKKESLENNQTQLIVQDKASNYQDDENNAKKLSIIFVLLILGSTGLLLGGLYLRKRFNQNKMERLK